jgi:CRISPR-associated protein (TIGR03986 family)
MAHVSPKFHIRTANAPYNFVTLPPAVLRARAIDAASLDRFAGRSGWFDCELCAETPTYIRGMYTAADFLEHGTKRMDQLNDEPDVQRRRAEFFKDAQGRLQIPASSLRGMLRTLFEIGVHGKMSRVSRRRMAFRSFEALNAALAVHYRGKVNPPVKGERNTSVPQVKAGYMRQRGDAWFVQPARTLRGATFCRVGHRELEEVKPRFRKDDDPTVWVKPGEVKFQEVRGGLVRVWLARAEDVSASEAPGYYKGALSRSGEIDKKASEVIVYPPDDAVSDEQWLKTEYTVRDPRDGRVLPIDVVSDYEAQLTPAQRKILGERGVLHDGHPVLYVERVDDGGAAVVDAIGHTMMMRVLYRYSPYDLLPAEMRDDAVQDLAEAVFGYVRAAKTTDGRAASAGRVQVTPGVCLSTAAEAEAAAIVPRVLGSPKPTTFQHYVQQNQPDDIGQLRHYDSPGAQLRGHKLYWHKGRVTVNDLDDPAALRPLDTQHTMIRPVKTGTKFRFRVHFENLSDLELGALLWVMDLAPTASARRLKLGMAKAYGAGSVSLDAELHLIDRVARCETLLDGDAWATAEMQADQAAEAARAAFRAALLNDKRWNRSGAARVEDLPRIQELLTMLAWPGTDHMQKDYMPLKTFRGRPVLPGPGDVGRVGLTQGRPESTSQDVQDVPAPVLPVEERPVAVIDLIPEVREVVDEKAEKLMETISARAIVEGGEYAATITATTKKSFECLLEDGKTQGTLERDLAVGNPSVGKTVRVKVRKITQIGGYVLTMKGVKQG